MSPDLSRTLNELAREKLKHADACEEKAREYEKAAIDMRTAAEAARAMVGEMTRLGVRPLTDEEKAAREQAERLVVQHGR